MTRRGMLAHVPGLPPECMRLTHPREDIETPVDHLGRVDEKRLITAVKATIHPDYIWDISAVNDHHLYWPKDSYVNKHGRKRRRLPDSEIRKDFYQLHKNQIRLPVVFHNWVHRVTEPPPVPDKEVIELTIKSWEITDRFFQSLQMYTRWQRELRRQEMIEQGVIERPLNEGPIDHKVIQEILKKSDEQLMDCYEELWKLPHEFCPVDPNNSMQHIAKKVGRLVAPEALVYTREVTLPIAA